MSPAPEQLADGLWRWTARHPEWHPGDFGSEVASFALKAGDETILVDPLLPPEADAVLDLIDRELGERLAILITIPYHVRSSEEIRLTVVRISAVNFIIDAMFSRRPCDTCVSPVWNKLLSRLSRCHLKPVNDDPSSS